MNREILFKAKRKDWKELPREQWWVEGHLFEFQPCQYMICDKKKYERPSTLPVLYFFRDCSYEIDPETICQYTGLTDKNGRKIWENDIVKHKDSQCFGIIRWYCGDYVGWCVYDVYDDEQQFTMDMLNECEVIGNIFDNADLLEVE